MLKTLPIKKIKRLIAILLIANCSAILANGATPNTTLIDKNKTEANSNNLVFQQERSTVDNQNAQSIDLETRPWSVLFYVGATTKKELGTLIRGEYTSASETLYSTELAYTLSKENIIRRFLSPVVGTIQLAGNFAYRIEHRDVPKSKEGDLYVMFRWINFPWNNYVTTTLAAGEGISYVSHIPSIETDGTTSDDSRRLLNYLVFEATFALPSHPEWQLVGRIHHRSTAYGVFGNTNGGSNNIGLGVRHYFNF